MSFSRETDVRAHTTAVPDDDSGNDQGRFYKICLVERIPKN